MYFKMARNMCTTVKSKLANTKNEKLIEEIIREARQAGSKCQLIGSSYLPYVKNVGIASKRLQENGKEIVTVLPSMYYSRMPKPYYNIKFKNMKNNWTLFECEFFKARPAISMECLHSSEYYFEDGLRKVRPYYKAQ